MIRRRIRKGKASGEAKKKGSPNGEDCEQKEGETIDPKDLPSQEDVEEYMFDPNGMKEVHHYHYPKPEVFYQYSKLYDSEQITLQVGGNTDEDAMKNFLQIFAIHHDTTVENLKKGLKRKVEKEKNPEYTG